MKWKQLLYQLCVTLVSLVEVTISTEGIFNPGSGENMMLHQASMVFLKQQQIAQERAVKAARIQAQTLHKKHGIVPIPPFSAKKFLTLPQLPIGMVGFPNNSFGGPNLVPMGHGLTRHNAMGTAKTHLGYIGLPPGSPVEFLKSPNWTRHGHGGPDAIGLIVNGPMLHPTPVGPQADPIHHLPMDHLFVPLPVGSGSVQGPVLKGPPLPPVADILIIIDASMAFGHIDPRGAVVWNPAIVDFLDKFISVTPMQPNLNRIGVVVVSNGIDDMIPLTHDKPYLMNSLGHLRPTFEGGCTEKGIRTAGSLFYQYGRPNAVKRIVLLSDSSLKCPYRNMAEILYARKCGIDIIHVGFGPGAKPKLPLDILERSYFFVPGLKRLPHLGEPVAKRAFIAPIHGMWSPWSDWNMCSAQGTCTVGYQMRFRLCDNPKPKFGGQICKGFPAETRMCYSKFCVDIAAAHWTMWTEFTPCSSLCGAGLQTRTRKCISINGQPSAQCKGNFVERLECSSHQCPVEGGWSLWSTWGHCSASCAMGVKMRARQCDNPLPGNGGAQCIGEAVEELVCDTGIPCPIHGGFGPFVLVGKCEGMCGMGRQKQVRACDAPIPQFGGDICHGDLFMWTDCDTGIPCPQDGHWSPWSDFTLCSVKCGVGIMHRKRHCDNPPPFHGGAICMGPDLEETVCDTGIPCPVHGQWSAWLDPKPCSVNCGVGLTQRVRVCNSPAPMFGGMDCIGVPVMELECDTGVPCPINGGWGLWTDFGICSVKCGIGIATRRRLCDSPLPMNGGALCVGLDIDQRECDTGVPCPVDGFWSHWLPWGECSAACEIGARQRHRLCNNPIPDFGGLHCKGTPFQEAPCDTGIPCPVDGGWSPWTPPMPCSVQCGVGTTRRTRDCNFPLPMHGGMGCFGPNLEVIECDTGIHCAIDGAWSLWGIWSSCGECGATIQHRKRFCNSPVPSFGGIICGGPDTEERKCDTGIPCPIAGGWSFWTEWMPCSAKCDVGVATRSRLCNSPVPEYGGLPCVGLALEEMKCDTGIPCPIHGGWSMWSELTSCSVACGVGLMGRTRMCINPVPMYGGLPCQGIAFEELPCDTKIACPVNGNWGPWAAYTKCSVDCGIGAMVRQRVCDSPAPMFGGMPCAGLAVEEAPCDTGVFCPIHGGWSLWGKYSLCSVPCGIGTMTRSRTCTNPIPLYGGLACPGFNVEETVCDTGIACPVDGNWGMWTGFTVCSAACGIGIQKRTRLCDNPPPVYGGGFCPGPPMEQRECDSGIPCPIPGGWTPWMKWSVCNAKCGVGMKERIRTCTNPIPMYGGQICLGPDTEGRPCDTGVFCPVDGQWTLWTGWTVCSAACGQGVSARRRQCADPPPMYGGLPCMGQDMEEMPCDTGIHCPIHGAWSLWGQFTPCSVKCGIGVIQRTRFCNSPLPQYGGEICPGPDTETKECDTGVYCAVDGGLSQWSKWSMCAGECGEGLQFRERLCDAPAPLYGGVPCAGIFRDERVCDTGKFCPLHGGWGLWTQFTPCLAECGIGVQERRRMCDRPVPMYGGMMCVGPDVEAKPCDTGVFCSIHGEWSLWSPWTDCSASCLAGVQFRERTCTNPPPQFGGLLCEGIATQEQVCSTGLPCPINGGWSFWTDWLPCNAKCGTGIHSRTRACNSPPPDFGGIPCIGPDFEETMCETGIPCPIPGGWGLWSKWSLCTASCGLGMQQRVRDCNNPAPMYGGPICIGDLEQIRECDTGIFCPTNGFWALWSSWTPCSEPCGMGFQGRSRMCSNPAPMHGGLFCEGPPSEKIPCDTITPCPIHGQWSLWSDISACDAICGAGFQTRIRTCTNPPPQFGGIICPGFDTEKTPCDSGIPCPIDGRWSAWTLYGPCIGKCGLGHQERSRVCNSPPPQFGGKPCFGPDLEVLECKTGVPCPIHGAWTSWYHWSACLADCGLGMRERRRECEDPPPQFGGLPCNGPMVEATECDTGMPCPIHGGWSLWSPPTVCSASCGIGIQTRVRSCTNPIPMYGGLPCKGLPEEGVPCDTGIPCPIHGNWGPWGMFGLCNVKCGVGMHARERRCDNPPPQFGGLPCDGPAVEETKCDTGIPCAPQGWSFWSPWSGCKASCGIGEQVRVRECPITNPADRLLLCHGPDTEVLPCEIGIPCPVHGAWTMWSQWDVCAVPCGVGVHRRYRDCANPIPAFGGHPCTGPAFEDRECIADLPCPVNGEWSMWAVWQGCSVDCGVGVRARERFCDSPPAQFGGLPCLGASVETEKCSSGVPCSVHGAWSSWTLWTDCSKICAIGTRVRQRFCNSPEPQFGGLPCAGAMEEILECDTGVPCPIDGQWAFWTPWSNCLSTCGVGEQRRERLCSNPPPQFGGLPCKGFAEEMLPCDTGVPCPIHGQWSFWSDFGLCSAKCEMGLRVRTRVCNNPLPAFGGLPCEGLNEDATGCDTGIPCPVHGHWSHWYGWSTCLGGCGMGKRERRRDCSNPKPLYGGLLCDGPDVEVGVCDTYVPCAADGNWGQWSPFMACSAKCGMGIQERFRECNNPPPIGGGLLCPGPAKDAIDCDTGIPCRVDGNWGRWSFWGMCSASCGFGVHTRERLCDSPPPQNGGAPCVGPFFEERQCDTLRPCATPPGWGLWSPWSKCSSNCAMGVIKRFRECIHPSPGALDMTCIGPDTETKECDSGVPCPINGGWGLWYGWSPCSVDCAIGMRERRRDCDSPIPQYGGMPCAGNSHEVADCDTGVPCPIHGGWTLWMGWSSCDKLCGIGLTTRARLCKNPPPAFGGLPCKGLAEETIECDTGRMCPIDGNWSPWSPPSPCSVPCGIGDVKRFRTCTAPPPQFGGLVCIGPDLEVTKCDTGVHCPVNGGWTIWSKWSMCSAKCGVGTSERFRKCADPAPMFGGLPCEGPAFEMIDCDSGMACPVDGNWSPWSMWDVCSSACGIGQKVRYRTCDNPRPANGGLMCIGLPEDMLDCDTGLPCPVHGLWALWSPWSSCDGACGGGFQVRFRTCSEPKPMFGGEICFGVPEEKIPCDTGVPCPMHGGWSLWSGWTICDAKCGGGLQARIRTCTEPRPQFGGSVCLGLPEETRPCLSGVPCPVDGHWGPWLPWKECSALCGIGQRKRIRLCDSPPPQFTGLTCPGFDTEEQVCDTGIPCAIPPGWSSWSLWSVCSAKCGVGVQVRERFCNNPPPSEPGVVCIGPPEDTMPCESRAACAINGVWTQWSTFGACQADCALGPGLEVGYTVRRRYCDDPPPSFGGISCIGPDTEKIPCHDYPPCFIAEWSSWSAWKPCSTSCGPGEQTRSRRCKDVATGLHTGNCPGPVLQTVPCQLVVCPAYTLNCSAECKWDNGIGYAVYPGDCSKFVQCEALDGMPRIHDCSWGLLWSLDLLQCVYPVQSECNICTGSPGGFRPYHISCRAYWDCTGLVPSARCCANEERFNPFTNQCELDLEGLCREPCNPDIPLMGLMNGTTQAPVQACLFRPSPKGITFYEEKIGGVWIGRPCSAGTVFSEPDCQCIYFTDGFNSIAPECRPDLKLTFDSLDGDMVHNPGLHIDNVRYLGDGTAFFDGTAAINDNTFANSEWGRDVYVHIRFKPEGKGTMQGLVHNSGCGPSDIGPSVFIGLDRNPQLYGPKMVNLKFAAVPNKRHLEYKFVNISTPSNQMIDAWFKYSDGNFEAEVNGQTVRLNIPGLGVNVARRHGALNIGGNLCKIGDVSFGGLVGIFDELAVYKCKPPGHFGNPIPVPLNFKLPVRRPPKPAFRHKPKPLLLKGPKPLLPRKYRKKK